MAIVESSSVESVRSPLRFSLNSEEAEVMEGVGLEVSVVGLFSAAALRCRRRALATWASRVDETEADMVAVWIDGGWIEAYRCARLVYG